LTFLIFYGIITSVNLRELKMSIQDELQKDILRASTQPWGQVPACRLLDLVGQDDSHPYLHLLGVAENYSSARVYILPNYFLVEFDGDENGDFSLTTSIST
jgi:hypothetical protein